jgi:hypothetical protein
VKAKRILKPCLKISPRNGEFWVKNSSWTTFGTYGEYEIRISKDNMDIVHSINNKFPDCTNSTIIYKYM